MDKKIDRWIQTVGDGWVSLADPDRPGREDAKIVFRFAGAVALHALGKFFGANRRTFQEKVAKILDKS